MTVLSRPAALALAHPRVAALALGAVAALGFRPLMLWPLTLAAMAAMFALVAQGGWKRAAGLGWLFGVGHFTIGNTWIATAFGFQAAMPAWLGMIAVVLLSFYLAVFPALSFAAARALAPNGKVALVYAAGACWIVAEWLRGWVCTGFPWNPLGAVTLGTYAHPGLARIVPWLGTYALSGLVALLAGGLWIAVARGKWTLAILPLLPFLLPLGGDSRPGTLPVTLVQPDIAQETLDDPARYEEHFQRTAALSAPKDARQRLVLWPESGVPDYLRPGYPHGAYDATTFGGDPAAARARLGRVIGPGSLLMTGTVDLAFAGDRLTGARNVVTALDASGAIMGGYAKAHLVPYGEYLPMRTLLEPIGLSRLVPGSIDFLPGPGPQTLDLGPWGRAGIQVCYEIVFSGQVVDRANRPDYLFNPSNDGWFGAWGPPQHLAQARLRAIEEGMPILRATTTGISAVIDAKGAVRRYLPSGLPGRIDTTVPPPAPPTLFARLGNALPLAWAALLAVLSLVASRRRLG
ncbi:apolipoprotein N-acyltransferase [Parablastomonas sp. CN1-191]|uniref:apolipoprotein N-acyltransferase n=1 Tax=Parablastomonas sp. CN1-191 TaxID=3400908 RepID=UPI003BF8E070